MFIHTLFYTLCYGYKKAKYWQICVEDENTHKYVTQYSFRVYIKFVCSDSSKNTYLYFFLNMYAKTNQCRLTFFKAKCENFRLKEL